MFLLRLALGGNAAFSTLSAVIFLVASQPIASFLGLLPGKQVIILGIQLGVFAAWLAWLSTRPAIPRWQVWLIIALDALWVAGSFQLLLAPPAAATSGRGSPPSSAAALTACKDVRRSSIAPSSVKSPPALFYRTKGEKLCLSQRRGLLGWTVTSNCLSSEKLQATRAGRARAYGLGGGAG